MPGNTATVTHSYTVEEDTTPPEITMATPWSNAPFKKNEVATASYQCIDNESGIASCDGTLPDGATIDTSKVGSFTFTVNATDKAGNTATLTHDYTVEGDTTPPTITFNAPAGYYYRDQVVTADFIVRGRRLGHRRPATAPCRTGRSSIPRHVGELHVHGHCDRQGGQHGDALRTPYDVVIVSPEITLNTPATDAKYELGDIVTRRLQLQ